MPKSKQRKKAVIKKKAQKIKQAAQKKRDVIAFEKWKKIMLDAQMEQVNGGREATIKQIKENGDTLSSQILDM